MDAVRKYWTAVIVLMMLSVQPLRSQGNVQALVDMTDEVFTYYSSIISGGATTSIPGHSWTSTHGFFNDRYDPVLGRFVRIDEQKTAFTINDSHWKQLPKISVRREMNYVVFYSKEERPVFHPYSVFEYVDGKVLDPDHFLSNHDAVSLKELGSILLKTYR